MLKAGRIALLITAALIGHAAATPRETSQQEPVITRDMLRNELGEIIRAEMPYPVITVFHGFREGKRFFTVNMDISKLGLPDKIYHATVLVPVNADQNTLTVAFRKLASWTKAQLALLLKAAKNQPSASQ